MSNPLGPLLGINSVAIATSFIDLFKKNAKETKVNNFVLSMPHPGQ